MGSTENGAMSLFPRLVLALSAVPFIAIGVAFFVAPGPMGGLIGISFDGATATTDARAVYGGLQIACGTLLALAARRPSWVAPGLVALLLLYGGLFAGRIAGRVLDGEPSPLGWLLAGGEATGLAFGLLAWRVEARAATGQARRNPSAADESA